MTKEKAKRLRAMIVKASASLSDVDALDAPELFPVWDGSGKVYEPGARVCWEGLLWRCLAVHTSQVDWTPNAAPSLWAKVLLPDPDEIPEWEQPDSTNPYAKGDKVRHNGKTWVSAIDGNVWEPGVYGWTEIG